MQQRLRQQPTYAFEGKNNKNWLIGCYQSPRFCLSTSPHHADFTVLLLVCVARRSA
jgi:hypothetical protein